MDRPRIRREQRTIRAMVELYCRVRHGSVEPCEACSSLLAYSLRRVEFCPWGERKGACSACAIHCFRAREREEIRRLMAWAGPRMLWRHPILALRHLLDKRRRPWQDAGAHRASRCPTGEA